MMCLMLEVESIRRNPASTGVRARFKSREPVRALVRA